MKKKGFEIPAWAYLFIGFVVSFISFYINSTQNTNRMILFFGFGIILLIVGIIKILFGDYRETDKLTKQHKHHDVYRALQQTSGKKGFRGSQVPGIKYCTNCGQLLRASESYCPKCGNASDY